MVATTTLTRVLVVNPAFLQEIKDSNPDLWDTVHQLRQTCECDDEPSQVAKRLVNQLDVLRDHIALQFALEESYGYLEVPEHGCSVACELATRAQSQHCPLYLSLSELAERAEELQYRGVAMDQLRILVEATRVFDAQLREHEQIESELIERSFGLH